MDADIIAALNGLLEEERADAEALVGLVAMATDTFERQALTAMGSQAAQGCVDLHERLARLGAPISTRPSNSAGQMLKHERIDDRLRAFAEVQRHLAGRCEVLQARDLDDETRLLLASLRAVQLVHAAWAEHRAEEFAATRPTDVEISSPSHAIPQDKHPPRLAGDAAAEETPSAPGADAGAGTGTIRAVDDLASAEASFDATPPDPAGTSAPDAGQMDVSPDGESDAPPLPAPKPRARRAHAGAQSPRRRASQKP